MRAVVVQMGVTIDGFVHGAHGYVVDARTFRRGTAIHTYRPVQETR